MTESECSLFPPNNILKSIYLSIFYLTYSHLVRVCSRSIYLSIVNYAYLLGPLVPQRATPWRRQTLPPTALT